jgi:hypothetical protein
MDAVHEQERTTLFGVLTGLTLLATVALLVLRAHLLVSTPLLLAIGVPWIAGSIYLRIHRAGVGGEGKYLDWWSVPHIVGGALLGLFDIGLVWVLLLTIWWECVESVSRSFEYFTNRVTDIVIAVVGWSIAQLIVTGGFTLV